MGLLVTVSEKEDLEAIEDIADDVATLWNEYGGKDYGFGVAYDTARIKQCYDKALPILGSFFPNPPGPFKRVATLLVFGRLYPFFYFTGRNLSPKETQEWLSRIVALMLPISLSTLKVNISTHKDVDTWVALDKWSGFPSVHYKVEFLGFLEWLDNFQWLLVRIPASDHKMVIDNRLARMTLALSLIIESCYYLGSEVQLDKNGPVRSNSTCVNIGADLTALSYDARLWKNHTDAHKAK